MRGTGHPEAIVAGFFLDLANATGALVALSVEVAGQVLVMEVLAGRNRLALEPNFGMVLEGARTPSSARTSRHTVAICDQSKSRRRGPEDQLRGRAPAHLPPGRRRRLADGAGAGSAAPWWPQPGALPGGSHLRCRSEAGRAGWPSTRPAWASRYTRSRRPVEVAWSRRMSSRSAAMREEARIKRLSRTEKLRLAGAD